MKSIKPGNLVKLTRKGVDALRYINRDSDKKQIDVVKCLTLEKKEKEIFIERIMKVSFLITKIYHKDIIVCVDILSSGTNSLYFNVSNKELSIDDFFEVVTK